MKSVDNMSEVTFDRWRWWQRRAV